jgi:hypothetical protein
MHVAIKIIKADAYREYRDLVEREIMVGVVQGCGCDWAGEGSVLEGHVGGGCLCWQGQHGA